MKNDDKNLNFFLKFGIVEYWRNQYQRMNKDRFFAANALALITHSLTQPFDMVKSRAQILQEGKGFNGIAF